MDEREISDNRFESFDAAMRWAKDNNCRFVFELYSLCCKDTDGDVTVVAQSLVECLEKDKLLAITQEYNSKDYRDADKFTQAYIHHDVLRNLKLSNSEHVALQFLLDYMGQENKLAVMLQAFAEHLNVHSKALIRTLDNLVNKGVIVFLRAFGKGRSPKHGIIMVNPRLYFSGKLNNRPKAIREFESHQSMDAKAYITTALITKNNTQVKRAPYDDDKYGKIPLLVFESKEKEPTAQDTDGSSTN